MTKTMDPILGIKHLEIFSVIIFKYVGLKYSGHMLAMHLWAKIAFYNMEAVFCDVGELSLIMFAFFLSSEMLSGN